MILYEFVKSLSHFLFQKNDSSLYKGAFDGQPQALSLYCEIELWDNMHLQYYITLHFIFVNSPLCFRHTHPTASRQRSIRILT